MTTPSQLRARAADLRDAARALRTTAPRLVDDAEGVLTHYPHDPHGVWWGPAATEFYGLVEGAKKRLVEIADDARDYARRCDERAEELDDRADRLEREQQGQTP